MRIKAEYKRSLLAVGSVGATAILAMLADGERASAVAAPPPDAYASYRGRSSVSMPIMSRDFTSSHADFAGTVAAGGRARYAKIPADTLDANGLPVFNSTGYKMSADWLDGAGRTIMASRSYINGAAGDVVGAMSATAGGAVTSASSFAQWFKAVPGVNTETRGSMTMNWNGSAYVFDGSLDTFANHTDFDYTAAIDTTFIHKADANWFINVGTGAEAFVYIDGKLVIDEGGGLGSSAVDPGMPGGHFDVDVYNAATSKQKYHKHQYDDSYNVTYVDIVNDANLLFSTYVPSNYANPLRVKFVNTDNAGWGTYAYAAGSTSVSDWVRNGCDRVFTASQLTQLRVDFRTLGLMAHTDPGTSHGDVTGRDGAFGIRVYDNVTNKLIYEVTAYHHGSAPAGYAQLVADYQAGANVPLNSNAGMPDMTQRIDLSRLGWLEDGKTHTLKVFFANRTGVPSRIKMETNINTLGLVALPSSIVSYD